MDTEHAIADLEKLKQKAPRVDLSITNYHFRTWRVFDPNTGITYYEEEKVITGGEHRQFKINKWTDLSKDTSFLRENRAYEYKFPGDKGEAKISELKPLTRLVVSKHIGFSDAAQ